MVAIDSSILMPRSFVARETKESFIERESKDWADYRDQFNPESMSEEELD